MKILELRILPPIAIGRLGSAEIPLAAYELQVSSEKPLDYRVIVPKETFVVDASSGEISSHHPSVIKFKDTDTLDSNKGRILPVAPFLEVFAITDRDPQVLVPLTTHLLEEAGYALNDLSWDIDVGNIKVFRRTGYVEDKIVAQIKGIQSHELKPVLGDCENFIEGKKLPLGTVQFIKPTEKFPEIRLRFTPAGGKVYGASLERHTSPDKTEKDPVITSEALILYDINKKTATWKGYSEEASVNPLYTNPAQIFAGYNLNNGNRVSWGYLDDECDGFVAVHLKGKEAVLTARAHISAGPPAFAPDTLPIRVVSDELEQILLSTEIEGKVSIDEAEDIIRRAFETIRLMNTTIMNGNAYDGKLNVASTMVRQNTNDFGRLYEPIMASSLVDNLALQVLHERVFNGLSTGAAPWFKDLLRLPTEIGDLSSKALRKMPALMRGADGRSLTFTYRQINTIIKAAANAMFESNGEGTGALHKDNPLLVSDLTAQLHYRGKGNPFSILPRTAISNCFPGLEFDFRNLWRRAFKGIVLIENNNYVIDADEPYKALIGCRLVAVNRKPTMVATSGPVFPDSDSVPLITTSNPNGVSFMEWSNSLVEVLQSQGHPIDCHFTAQPSKTEVVVDLNKLDDKTLYQSVSLVVNTFFDADSAVFSEEVLKPGELTQGLCAPWQNDYRECACYYWAASRPDFVNIEPDENGLSTGDTWMAKKRSGKYIPDDRTDSRLLSYDDLFENWEGQLNFIIKGKDALQTENKDPKSV